MELEESVPIASNLEYYAKIVREKTVKRDLIAATAKIQHERQPVQRDPVFSLARGYGGKNVV
jgi:replicative DNA helicase